MGQKKDDTESIRISQVLAGALAAVTAALIGSTMGVAGTVVGAGLASVISTVGGALYLKSIQRTRESVRTVKAKVVGRSGGATVLVAEEDPAPGEEVRVDTTNAEGESPEEQTSDDRPPAQPRRYPRWLVLAGSSVAAFVLGMLVITGVEWLHGQPLSGGAGTTFGSIVQPPERSGGGGGQPADPTTSTTVPTTTTPPTSTDATNTTDPTTTSTPPSSGSSTSSTPPVTTTTESTAPSVPNPPSQ